MNVTIERALKMPVLFSYFVDSFSEDTKAILDKNKPFAFFHKSTQKYEMTEEVFQKLSEKQEKFVDNRIELPKFEREHNEKYGYQADAVSFSFKTNSIFINFPQGMGKTLTALKIVEAHGHKKVLVICGQSNLQEEWLKDARKHNMIHLNLNIVGMDTGAGTKKKVAWIEAHKDIDGIDLINIEALRNVDVTAALSEVQYDCMIVDEVQSAKGWKTEQTKGLNEIVSSESQYRIALSGTPVLNDPLEYFSLLKFLRVFRTGDGRLLDVSRTTFEKYYGEWAFDFWGHYVCKGFKHLEELSALITPIWCYVDKSELGLPQKTRKKINVQDIADEYNYLNTVYRMPIKSVRKKGFKTKSEIRSKMQFLSSTMPSKIEFVKNTAERQLVFSQYTQVLDVYYKELKDAGKRVLFYHGKLNMKERLQVLEDWSNNKADILLLSLMAARYGLNLTEASVTTFIEPPTSMPILEQGEDRAHRIGQEKEVNSYLLCSSNLDEEALENIQRKQESIDKLKELLIN